MILADPIKIEKSLERAKAFAYRQNNTPKNTYILGVKK